MRLDILFLFHTVNKPHVKAKINKEVIILMSFPVQARSFYLHFLCATELHCCPKTNKKRHQ